MRQEIEKIIKFSTVGGLSVVLYYSTFLFLIWIGVHAIVATIFTYTATAIINFTLNKSWTFRIHEDSWSRSHLTRQISLTVLMHILALGINVIFVWIGTHFVGAHSFRILIFKIVGDATASILSYLMNRFVIFKPQPAGKKL